MKIELIFYAPNVHTGGGLVLLKDLIEKWPGDFIFLILDKRVRKYLQLPLNLKVFWVNPSFISRIIAEFILWKKSTKNINILCFHSLPPLLKNKSQIILFLQNRNYLSNTKNFNGTLKVKSRIAIEKLIFMLLRKRISKYIVQTPSMQNALLRWYTLMGDKISEANVKVLPFIGKIPKYNSSNTLQWDFIYPADGEAHKNHLNLLIAWKLLAYDGIKPSLCLTINDRYVDLKNEIKNLIKNGLKIYDVGEKTRDDIIKYYYQSKALIFPSYSESFGLPLIEADTLGLPILAPELDYVRDVCIPRQTFDPNSPVSIARSIKRFLNYPDMPINIEEPDSFWSDVLGRN